MAKARSRAWRRTKARLKDGRKARPQNNITTMKICRKLMWRRRDKLFLRRQEGHMSLDDDWD